ncbi:DUF5017 domain-containing protein [Dysgonomonas sp. 520]|uniref:DUF5017 domain-containing protein n=1 Tax=Dysgonomonas sp. 520 TaxID=2302931 RepID=UPI0021023AAD|nr:DUF5017 domain-containing protein [Dysgonomonas sp. 520]
MKIFFKILLGVCLPLFLLSCEEESADTPIARMTINKDNFEINESMIINFTGYADQVVVYTGDDMHNYELREQSNTGFVVNKGLFTYSYSSPGIYKVVCIASTHTDKAKDLKRDTCSFTVTVIDNQTEIDKLSCPQILYDEVFAQKLADDEWLMVLPRKVKYNNSTPSIALSQRLRFYIQSDSTKVFVNDAEYSSTTKYNLSNTVYISVKSDFGTVRPYKLHTMYYPEFNTFKMLGAEGTLIRNEFDYSTFDMAISLPAGTDISNIIPEFTTHSSTDKVYIGNIEQTSGTTAVDFSQNVVYRLVSISPENANLRSKATVNVKISYQ